MAALGVFLLSASALAFEVLLTRHFPVAQHHHLQFLVLSIALLGTGAGGTLLNLRRRGPGLSSGRERFGRRLPLLAAGCSAAIPAGFIAVNALPLDYFRIALSPLDFLCLLVSFFLFALPFLAAGLATALAYAAFPEKAGIVSVASLSGSAAGAFLPLAGLPLFGMSGSLAIAAALPLPAALLAAGKKAWPARTIALVTAAGLAGLFAFGGKALLETRPSSYKSLSEFLARSGSRLLSSSDSLSGRIDVAEGPTLRSAPGLSLGFRGTLPPARAVFLDAGPPTLLYGTGMDEEYDFTRQTLPYIGFAEPRDRGEVLVVSRGGGNALAAALSSGAAGVTLLDDNPERAALVRAHYRSPRLAVPLESARSFLKSNPRRFDAILVEHPGTELPGLESLAEDYLLTREAVRDCLLALGADGVLVYTRALLLPPAGLMRLAATAWEALAEAGEAGPPEGHLFVASGLGVYTLVVSRSPLGPGRIRAMKDFAGRLNFDLVYYPGMPESEANRFFVFPEPYFYRAVVQVIGAERAPTNERDRLLGGLPFDVSPVKDDRPFFSRFIKWERAGEFVRLTGDRAYVLSVSGEVVAVCVLGAAAVLCALLLVLPSAAGRRGRVAGKAPLLFFFPALGAGYMWIELALISQGTLAFGHPAPAFLFVLVLLFVSSASGGLLSQRLSSRLLPAACAAIALAAAGYAALSGAFLPGLLSLPGPWRFAVSALPLLPLGFLMGIPFPLSQRTVLPRPGERAYAWAVNGCASVLGAVLEVLAAWILGFRLVILAAAALYGAAGLVAWLAWTRRGRAETDGKPRMRREGKENYG